MAKTTSLLEKTARLEDIHIEARWAVLLSRVATQYATMAYDVEPLPLTDPRRLAVAHALSYVHTSQADAYSADRFAELVAVNGEIEAAFQRRSRMATAGG